MSGPQTDPLDAPFVEAPSDRERADRIRELLCKLNREINDAKAAGLKVELSFYDIGCPTWKGYQGAVKITREL